MIAKQTVFLTGDRSKAVPEGHADAKFLLVREGSEIADKEAEKYNAVALIDSEAKKKPAEPQQQEPPTLKEQPVASDTASATPPAATPAAPVDGKTEKAAKSKKVRKAPKAKKAAKAKK